MIRRASCRLVNQLWFKHSSRNFPLKLSMKAFCTGLPGSIKCNATLFRCSTLRFSQRRDDLLFAESTPLHTPSPLTVLYPEKFTFVWIKFRGSRSTRSGPTIGGELPNRVARRGIACRLRDRVARLPRRRRRAYFQRNHQAHAHSRPRGELSPAPAEFGLEPSGLHSIDSTTRRDVRECQARVRCSPRRYVLLSLRHRVEAILCASRLFCCRRP